MKPGMLAAIVAASLLAAIAGPSVELNEDLLGLAQVPFKIGQIVSPDDLSAQSCRRAKNALNICPTVQGSGRGFAFILEESEGRSRITSVLSYWKCDPSKCAQELKETVGSLTKRLGAEPALLGETPIWRDREKHQRDLLVQMLGPDMVSIVLLESK